MYNSAVIGLMLILLVIIDSRSILADVPSDNASQIRREIRESGWSHTLVLLDVEFVANPDLLSQDELAAQTARMAAAVDLFVENLVSSRKFSFDDFSRIENARAPLVVVRVTARNFSTLIQEPAIQYYSPLVRHIEN